MFDKLRFWLKVKSQADKAKKQGGERMQSKLKSRKLWAAVLTAALLALNDQLGIFDQETATKLVGIVIAYIIGQSAVDYGERRAAEYNGD